MKTTIRILTGGLALAALLFATGCQSVSITSTQAIGGPTYPPSKAVQVEILRTEPSKPHVRLGEVCAEPSDESVPAAKIEVALREAAAKLGADAAVVVSDPTQVIGVYVTGPWYGRPIERVAGRVVTAVAIKYQ